MEILTRRVVWNNSGEKCGYCRDTLIVGGGWYTIQMGQRTKILSMVVIHKLCLGAPMVSFLGDVSLCIL